MRDLLNEFKDFILHGDVISISIGFVIANAFTELINSFTSVFLTPLITLSTNGIQFQDLSFKILGTDFFYGRFINSAITFIITGFLLFMVLKGYNKLRETVHLNTIKKKAKQVTAEDLLTDIRDILRKQQNSLNEQSSKTTVKKQHSK